MKLTNLIISALIAMAPYGGMECNAQSESKTEISDTTVVFDAKSPASSVDAAKNKVRERIEREVVIDNSDNDNETAIAVAEAVQEALNDSDSGFGDGGRGAAVAVMAVIGIFYFPLIMLALMIVIVMFFVKRNRDKRARLIELSIKERVPLPREFYMRGRVPEARLNSGLIWMAWGLGLMIFFISLEAEAPSALMSVPVLIGASKLITYFLIERRRRDQESDDQQD